MSGKKYFLTNMLVFKNEALYLKEWLDYHILTGVQHFYLYDNNSKDDLSILDWYEKNNIITYRTLDVDFTFDSPAQPHRMEAISKYGPDSQWMMFNDIDEFIYVPNRKDNIHRILDRYSEYSAIALKRVDFGNNGLSHYDNRLVIERFSKRNSSATHFKSVARPKHIKDLENGHYFNLKKRVCTYPKTMTFSRQPLNPMDKKSWLQGPGDPVYINHYVCKSKEECFGIKNKYTSPKERDRHHRRLRGFFINRWSTKKWNAVDGGMSFYIKYLQNDFVRKNYSQIKEYYEFHSLTKELNLETLGA
tara:strand:- start:37485 stop:38396 length:912 start_codon:yes stop_codon:yes gene_type:complete